MRALAISIAIIAYELYARTPASAKEFAQSDRVLELGRGFDSATGEAKARCLINIKTNTKNGAQSAILQIDKVDNVETMLSVLRIGASARFKTGAWDGFADSRYLKTSQYTSTHSHFFARILVHNVPETIDTADLTTAARAALNRGKSEFHKLCGDAYVSTTASGGEFLAIYRYDGDSASDAQSFASSIGARFVNLLTSAKVSADIESSFNQFSSNNKLKIEIIRRGYTGALPPSLTPDALTRYALNFPSLVRDSARPIPTSFSIGSYAELGYQVRPTGLDVDAVLIRLISVLDRSIGLLDEIQDVLDTPGRYSFASRRTALEAMEKQKKTLAALIDTTREFAQKQCLGTRETTQSVPDKCNFASIPSIPLISLPPRFSDVGGCSLWSQDSKCLRCEYSPEQLGLARLRGQSAPAICGNMPIQVPIGLRITGTVGCADRNQYGNECGAPGVDWWINSYLHGTLDSKSENTVDSPLYSATNIVSKTHKLDLNAAGTSTDGFVAVSLVVAHLVMWPNYPTGLTLNSDFRFIIYVKDLSPHKPASGYGAAFNATR